MVDVVENHSRLILRSLAQDHVVVVGFPSTQMDLSDIPEAAFVISLNIESEQLISIEEDFRQDEHVIMDQLL